MGKRGGQPGNTNASNGAPWRKAIRRALATYSDDKVAAGKALRQIAHKLVEKALAGDRDAIGEIGNRLDGKAPQYVEKTVNHVRDRASLEAEVARLHARLFGAPGSGVGGFGGDVQGSGSGENTKAH